MEKVIVSAKAVHNAPLTVRLGAPLELASVTITPVSPQHFLHAPVNLAMIFFFLCPAFSITNATDKTTRVGISRPEYSKHFNINAKYFPPVNLGGAKMNRELEVWFWDKNLESIEFPLSCGANNGLWLVDDNKQQPVRADYSKCRPRMYCCIFWQILKISFLL